MQTLSAEELLALWERGQNSSFVSRALALVHAAWPELDEASVAELTIGARDERLLQIRAANFGETALVLATCPACGDRVESSLELPALKALGGAGQGSFQARCGAARVEFRLPSSRDLLAVLGSSHPERARADLLERCIVAVEAEPGENVDGEALLAAVASEMERVDPTSDIQLGMACACGRGFSVTFDIVSYLWREIEVAARRLLEDVHALAAVYGWSERAILELSPARRRAYLELVNR